LKQSSTGWLAPAQGFAGNLLKGLFVFEIFMLGVQALLFHQDLQQLFASLAFKTFVACFFIYLISNAGTLFPAILSSFQLAGQNIGTGDQSLFNIFAQGDNAAALFFCAAMSSHEGDLQGEAIQVDPLTICGKFNVGSGNLACSIGAGIGHLSFEFYAQLLGLLVIASMGLIFLSLMMLMSEAYIVMFAGAIFLGFSATRFTLPFSQGYLSYMFNVGARLFTFWIVIAIEQVLLLPMLQSAGIDLVKAGAVKFGLGAEMLLVPAAVAVAQIMSIAALAWFLPRNVGRFVSGRSPLAALKSISNSLNASAQLAAARPSGHIAPAISYQTSTAQAASQPAEVVRKNTSEQEMASVVHAQAPPPLSMSTPVRAAAQMQAAGASSSGAATSISSPGFSADLIRPSAASSTRSEALDFNTILTSAGTSRRSTIGQNASLDADDIDV
jgi:hypothetical protein